MLGEDGSHRRELDEVLRVRVDVGADVEEHHRPGGRDQVGRQCGAIDPLDAAEPEDRGRHRRAGGSGADDRIGVAVSDHVGGDHDR
jgi:hypothetical protein